MGFSQRPDSSINSTFLPTVFQCASPMKIVTADRYQYCMCGEYEDRGRCSCPWGELLAAGKCCRDAALLDCPHCQRGFSSDAEGRTTGECCSVELREESDGSCVQCPAPMTLRWHEKSRRTLCVKYDGGEHQDQDQQHYDEVQGAVCGRGTFYTARHTCCPIAMRGEKVTQDAMNECECALTYDRDNKTNLCLNPELREEINRKQIEMIIMIVVGCIVGIAAIVIIVYIFFTCCISGDSL